MKQTQGTRSVFETPYEMSACSVAFTTLLTNLLPVTFVTYFLL